MSRVFFALFLTCSLNGVAQSLCDAVPKTGMEKEGRADTSQIYSFAEQPAEFPGGFAVFLRSFQACLKEGSLPEACGAGCITFHLKFTVEKDGSLSRISLRSPRCEAPAFEMHCVAVLTSLPAWKPALLNNRPVRTYFDLPLRIRIN